MDHLISVNPGRTLDENYLKMIIVKALVGKVKIIFSMVDSHKNYFGPAEGNIKNSSLCFQKGSYQALGTWKCRCLVAMNNKLFVYSQDDNLFKNDS